MILTTICKLALAMGLGYYLRKKNIFTEEINQKLSFMVMNFCLPLMIVTAMNNNQAEDRKEIMGFLLVGIAFYLIIPVIGKGLCKILKVEDEEKPIYEMFFVFANVTFMGYPVAASLYGNGCIFYISIFNLMFNLMLYTYGIKKVNHGKPEHLGKNGIRAILNNGMIMSVVAVLMFFLNLRLPVEVAEVFSFIGDLATPLSMVITGSTIGTYSIKELMTENKRLYPMAMIRMILIPFAVYWIMTWLGFSDMLRGIATITLGMPVASAVGMTCVEHNSFLKIGPPAVALTTVLSLGIIPFLLLILG